MNTVSFNKGEVIFRQGDASDGMYAVVSGSVGVYLGYQTDAERELTVLKAGSFLGEMGLIEAYPRSGAAVALEDGTELQVISEKEFDSYFKDRPEQLLSIMRQLSRLLRERSKEFEEASRILEEMNQTHGDPGKRSNSLLQQIRSLMDFYDNVMSAYGANANEDYFTTLGMYHF